MKKSLSLLLIYTSFSYGAYEQLDGEQKQELLMNMFFGRHLTKEPEAKNDPSLATMLYERNKDVYWDFYCMLRDSKKMNLCTGRVNMQSSMRCDNMVRLILPLR